jgi:hypothetical protein
MKFNYVCLCWLRDECKLYKKRTDPENPGIMTSPVSVLTKQAAWAGLQFLVITPERVLNLPSAG